MLSRTRRSLALAATATALALGTLAGPGASADSSPQLKIHKPRHAITPVLGGLAAPRGIVFDGRGNMYVAQSGVAGKGPGGMTHTGRVSKYKWHHKTPTWETAFSSLYITEQPGGPPDVLGPEGLSALGNGCTRRSVRHRPRCQVLMIMSESTPGILAASHGAVFAPQAGHLYGLDRATGAATNRADIGTQMYRWTGTHRHLFPSDFPDSNPYAVLVTSSARSDRVRTFVADAGANTVSEVGRNGRARIIAYIPNEKAAPFRDATPTCIAQGPDGFLYVGTLHFVSNLFVHNGNQSDVWRINPNASYPTRPQLWTSGLTTITGCTFDRSGNFWATEMFQGGLHASPPGDIVKIPFRHPRRHTRIGFGHLPLPGGIAQGPDGAMYVTVGSAAPGRSGGVMRVAQ